MQLLQLASFNGLANGQRASAQVPAYAASLGKIDLRLTGNLTKANVSEIVAKVGSKTFFGPISATNLDKINAYKGIPTNALFASIDLTEPDGMTQAAKEVGAIDLPALGGDAVFVEVVNTAASGTPILNGRVGYVGRQFLDKDGDGKATRQEQLMHKLLRYSLPNTGTRYVWQPQFGGAQIKRVYFMYAGTDWTASADGNLSTVECKLNGRVVHERVACLDNRYHQTANDKTPQSRMYVLDFIADDVAGNALDTRRARSLEFTLELAATDNVEAYVECLDVPRNL